MAERMLLEFAESDCPIFRATSPLSRGRLRSKGHGKLSIHYAADSETMETIFRIIVSANQLSLYGAIAEICEEYETFHERTGRPVVMVQSSSSLVLSVIKTEVPLDCDDLANQDHLLQQYGERIEKLLQQDKLSKFCMDAGFLNIIEIGQYFMTKDTEEQSSLSFSALCCAQNYSLTSWTKTMAKRMQEQKEGDNRSVAKSKPTTMNLAFSVSTSSSTVNSPIASKNLGILKAPCRTDWSSTGNPDARDRNHDGASGSQGWQKDAFADVSTGKPVAPGYPGNSENSGTERNDEDWPHNLHIATNCVLRMEKIFSIVRQRYGLSPTDLMKILDVNTAIWGIFMPVTLQLAVHLGKEYTENLQSQGDGVPQGMSQTGCGGLASVPRLCKHLLPSSRRGKYLQFDARKEDGVPARVSGRHVVRG